MKVPVAIGTVIFLGITAAPLNSQDKKPRAQNGIKVGERRPLADFEREQLETTASDLKEAEVNDGVRATRNLSGRYSPQALLAEYNDKADPPPLEPHVGPYR